MTKDQVIFIRYATATLPVLALLLLEVLVAGPWGVIALVYLTLFAAVLDKWLTPPISRDIAQAEPHWPDRLSAIIGLGHLVLLPCLMLYIASPAHGGGEKLVSLLAVASFMGQISHPNAHELIHRRPAWLSGLGMAVYTSMIFGQHVSAHRLVHHRFVGTKDDPNTPLSGESFWRYLPRAWIGSFKAGLAQENAKLARKSMPAHSLQNPYYIWVAGGALTLILALALGGVAGLFAMIGLAALAHIQIMLSDYIQHYGLTRLTRSDGRLEPVGAHHSWNAPRGFTSYLMLNAPSHSDHHMHPDRPYDSLTVGEGEPVLPFSMPIMAVIATIPPVWHRNMDKRAARVMAAAQAALP